MFLELTTIIMNSTRYFRQFLELSRPGIYVLVNNRHKRVAVAHTNDLLRSIASIVTSINHGTHKCQKLNEQKDWLSLEILETVEDSTTRYLRYEHWVAHYRKLGYKTYFYKKALQYQVKLDILPDFTHGNNNLLAYVHLINKRRDKLVVGVFNNIEEAKGWIEETYRPMDIISPVYAVNDLSREYFKWKNKI